MLENIKKSVTNYAKDIWNKKQSKDKILENKITNDMFFENMNFANMDLSNKTLKNVKFINCDLSGVDFTRTFFQNVTFENCNGNNAIFRDSNVFDCNLTASWFDNANFKDANINNVNIELSSFQSASFKNAGFSATNNNNIDKSNFKDADFTNVYFSDYKVSNSQFRGANLPGNIHNCNFVKSDLRDTNLQYVALEAVKFEDTLINTGIINKAKGDVFINEVQTNEAVSSMNNPNNATNLEQNVQNDQNKIAETKNNTEKKVDLSKEDNEKVTINKTDKEEITEVKVANEPIQEKSSNPSKSNNTDPMYDDDYYNNLEEPPYEELDNCNNLVELPPKDYEIKTKKEIEVSLKEKNFEKAYKAVLDIGGSIKTFLSKVIEHFGANSQIIKNAVESVAKVENKPTEFAVTLFNDTLKSKEYQSAFEKKQSKAQGYAR